MTPPPLIAMLKELIPNFKMNDVADRAGLSDVTIRNWFNKGTDPRLSLFLAALNSVGYTLEIVPMEKE